MKNKFLNLIGSGVLATLIIISSANAQGINAYSVYGGGNQFINYLMGVVNLGSGQAVPSNNINIPTNIVPNNPAPVSTVCSPSLTTFHKFGDKGQDVATLQLLLNEANGSKLNGKGYFGPATLKEVKNFQYNYGIKVTGMQYEKTTATLNAIHCGLIAKKQRAVFTGNLSSNASVSVAQKPQVTNVYPNPNPESSVNIKPKNPANQVGVVSKNKESVKKDSEKIDDNSSSSEVSTSGFSADLEKIKENYKAYILVFVLVLALFWFLRKAATE